MRVALIVLAVLLLSVICVSSKRAKSEKKCEGEERGDEGAVRKDKLRGADSGEDNFRWNRNFKKHKQNAYEKLEKKPDASYRLKEKIREYAKPGGELKKIKEKRSKSKTENAVDPPKPSTTDIQCDSVENTCSAAGV